MISANKKKLLQIVLVGTLLTFLVFLAYISIGQSKIYNPIEALQLLVEYIQNPSGCSIEAKVIGIERFPRSIAVLFIGIGLSIAGAMYQAVIRNPLVDPYIMGVSSGAGVAAIAVIAFNFTFFGLLSPSNMFITPIAAIVGGLIAFFITMTLAEKAGGSSVSYVLAGVIIGMALGALQTMLLQGASNTDLPQALSWLFGSFKGIMWSEIPFIVFPVAFLILLPLFKAREMNLVLLGEDQARQMGLDTKNFNRIMLITASVLASICVAFVGIIGFVGLVVPHVCRMIWGGDHRFVIPASIFLGGSLLMIADLIARMAIDKVELPVGAITTLIGVPVFAYLLIRKGRMYDG